jgi:hypothetical protein
MWGWKRRVRDHPTRTQGLPVYRADLTPPVSNAEHGNAVVLGLAGRGHPNRKAGQQAQHWDGRRSQSRCVTRRIRPRRPGLAWQEQKMEPLQPGNAIDEQHLSFGASRCCCPNEHSRNGHRSALPSCPKGIRCILKMNRYQRTAGRFRKGLALAGFEPCEGKLSRTVLRGGVGGLTACAYPAAPPRVWILKTLSTTHIGQNN